MERIGKSVLAATVASVLAFGVGVAVGQNAPTENKGVTVSPATALSLAGQVEGLEGRQLRLRVVTVAPAAWQRCTAMRAGRRWPTLRKAR